MLPSKQQCIRLQLNDIYVQIHWPVTGNVGREVIPSIPDTWRAMEKLVKDVSCLT